MNIISQTFQPGFRSRIPILATGARQSRSPTVPAGRLRSSHFSANHFRDLYPLGQQRFGNQEQQGQKQ